MNLQTFVRKLQLKLPSPCESIYLDSIKRNIIVKRDDLIHPIISGNKWRKLYFHFAEYFNSDKQCITSMGGVYSNHLHALAYCCQVLKIPCRLLIYGHHSDEQSETLKDMEHWDAECIPISRTEAAILRAWPDVQCTLLGPDDFWIPEGGGGARGILGIESLIAELPTDFDQPNNLVLSACGTGTTISGLLQFSRCFHIESLQTVRSAEYPFAKEERFNWISTSKKQSFAKNSTAQFEFYKAFHQQYGFELDQVYTGPLLFSFLQKNNAHSYNNILLIHSGGIQGNRSINK